MRLLYHLTCVDNLPSILDWDGLAAYNCLQRAEAGHVDIAHRRIQERRARWRVPVGAGGTLHDYVPFYFAARPPMLYALCRGAVEQFAGGQERIVYLVTSVEAIHEAGLAFVFTDGHAAMAVSHYFTALADLEQIDWAVMRATLWADTEQDGDRKRRRQAEFLVHEFVPWTLFRGVVVISAAAAREVQAMFSARGIATPVRPRRDWYY